MKLNKEKIMKKKLLLTLLFVVMTMCLFAVAVSAETAYVNANGEQVEEGSPDIAYELYFEGITSSTGGCKIKEVYLYDSTVTKLVVPEVKFTVKDVEYDLSTYSFVRIAAGWSTTLPVYLIAEKDSETKTSVHTQIKEIEFHIPVLGDGAGQAGNLAGYTALEKISFYKKAYEPQNKGGFLYNCPNLKEVHFYGQDNQLSGNFFVSSMNKVVFHRGSTTTLRSCAMNAMNNGNECYVYLNEGFNISDETDPRLTWNKNGNGFKIVILVDDTSNYTAEEIISHETIYQAGNNKNENNYRYNASVMTYCDFYDGHISEEPINDCVCYCSTCKNYGALANPVHTLFDVYSYANGYSEAGERVTKCTNEGCLHVDGTEVLDALFLTKGYSKDTTSNAIHFDFSVNNDAIKVYEAYLKNVDAESTVSYGVVVAVADLDEDETNDKLFNAEGELKAGTVEVKFNEKNYSNIKIKLTGIGEGNYDTALHISGYFKVNDGVTYINDVGTSEYAQKVTYNSLPSEE